MSQHRDITQLVVLMGVCLCLLLALLVCYITVTGCEKDSVTRDERVTFIEDDFLAQYRKTRDKESLKLEDAYAIEKRLGDHNPISPFEYYGERQ